MTIQLHDQLVTKNSVANQQVQVLADGVITLMDAILWSINSDWWLPCREKNSLSGYILEFLIRTKRVGYGNERDK